MDRMTRSRQVWSDTRLLALLVGGVVLLVLTVFFMTVLLEWPGFKLFVTPADREGFCAAVLARSKRAGGAR